MAKGKGGKQGDVQPIIIIKKIKKVAGGHHGGAWKVAYADFVTAMMAFFLLLWLLNVTTSEQRDAIANFFDPTHPMISDGKSGSGGVLGGTTVSTEGSMSSTMQEIRLPQNSGATNKGKEIGDTKKSTTKQLEEELRRRETERFEDAKKALEKEIANTPELAELKKHMMVEVTPEGLEIQIIDQEGEPMFPSGSAQMYDKTKRLITLATTAIKKMPNNISVRGHTDAAPYKAGANYTNWELSADRANATRRVLKDTGIPESRLSNVMGKADTDNYVKDKPLDAKNRRISIVLEREDIEEMIHREGDAAARDIGIPEAADEAREILKRAAEQSPSEYKRTPGDVYFP